MNKLMALSGYHALAHAPAPALSNHSQSAAADNTIKQLIGDKLDQDKKTPGQTMDPKYASPQKSTSAMDKIEKISPPNPLRFSMKKASPGLNLGNKLSPHSSDDQSGSVHAKGQSSDTPDELYDPLKGTLSRKFY